MCVCGTGANVNASNPNCIGDIEEEEKTKLAKAKWTTRRQPKKLLCVVVVVAAKKQ